MLRTLAVAIMPIAALSACAHPRVPFAPRHPQVVLKKSAMGDWRLERRRNPFSEAMACRLRARDGKAFFQGGAIAFRFPAGWDVHEAFYRLDRGVPQSWRDDLPELVRIGVPIDQGGVVNASAGLVWIPWRKLTEANRVAIQARPNRAARIFHLGGLKGLYEAAVAQGCAPDSRFER